MPLRDHSSPFLPPSPGAPWKVFLGLQGPALSLALPSQMLAHRRSETGPELCGLRVAQHLASPPLSALLLGVKALPPLCLHQKPPEAQGAQGSPSLGLTDLCIPFLAHLSFPLKPSHGPGGRLLSLPQPMDD